MTDKNCIFCQLIDGYLPADIVYQDELVVAFNDINPRAPVHILVIPRLHIETLNDFSTENAELLGHLVLTGQKIAREKHIDSSGYRLVCNCNKEGGQVVYHVHFHILGGKQLSGF